MVDRLAVLRGSISAVDCALDPDRPHGANSQNFSSPPTKVSTQPLSSAPASASAAGPDTSGSNGTAKAGSGRWLIGAEPRSSVHTNRLRGGNLLVERRTAHLRRRPNKRITDLTGRPPKSGLAEIGVRLRSTQPRPSRRRVGPDQRTRRTSARRARPGY